MARPRGSKNKDGNDVTKEEFVAELEKYVDKGDIDEKIVNEIMADSTEQDDETVSVYEASQRLNANESTIKVWIDHGHLRSINGRITVGSIRECRFNIRRPI